MRLLRTMLLALAVAGPSFADEAAKPAKAEAQDRRAPSKRITAQQQAMKALPLIDGEWRRPARKKNRDGWVEMTQIQRVATLLDGTVRTIETKGFEKTYKAFAFISFDPDAKVYSMHLYSNGRVRDYPLKATSDGFFWEMKSGSDVTIRYENTFRNSVWKETATRLPDKGGPETYLEFSIKRFKGL